MQTESNQNTETTTAQTAANKDSLGIDVKKSPWLIFALLQIPIVIGMVILIYFMKQNAGGN